MKHYFRVIGKLIILISSKNYMIVYQISARQTDSDRENERIQVNPKNMLIGNQN